MDTKDWQKIKQITLEAIGLQSFEQAKYLGELELSPEIRKEVETLLKFENTAENWFLPPALDLSKESFSDNSPEQSSFIGTKIGVYEIIGELGLGGMGAVFLAERTVGKSTQKVAVKLLKREMNTDVLRRHFRHEQEILATLEHPNIARLLDVGTTVDGIPYLAMEYVEGTRIDKFCTENKLGLNERLKLFNKVCEAVSFAHQNLIIHRDIKPSNILVSKTGELKLLDFGISKLIDETNETTKTITQLGAMTPEYASPEQIKGESVTTATDIYSLGVVLFKILTGTMPYDTNDKQDVDIFQKITKSQPTTPSQAIQNNPKSAIQNPKSLKGDLDNIILTSLCKEPERRYRTVEQFSADIWRFIDGLPVTARPATFSYRASKFYKRNKIQVLASVLVILSLIAGIAVAVWQASIAREQSRIASVAQQKAEAESAKSKEKEERAKKITEFMEKIITYANPGKYAAGFDSKGEAKVIDVLDELSGDIDNEFPDKPDIQAELHHKFAEVYTIRYSRINDKQAIEKAVYHAKKAIKLRKKFYGEKHELVAKDMYYLWASKSKTNENDNEDLAKLLAEAIQMMRETNPNNLNFPYMLLDYSNRLWNKNEKEIVDVYYRNAIPKSEVETLVLAKNYLEESLSKFRNHYPENHSSIVVGKCLLGIVQIKQGEFIKAEKNFPFCQEHPYPERHFISLEQYSVILEEGLQK